MASLSKQLPDGTRRVQFTDPDRRRRSTLYLGKIAKRPAEELRGLVERLNAAALAGHAPADKDARTVAELPDATHRKSARNGLVEPRRDAGADTLGPFLAAYLADRDDAKPNTRRHLSDAARHLLRYFPEGKKLRDVTPADADGFRRHLARGDGKPRGENTVNRHMGRAVQFFRHAERSGLIDRNPFAGQKVAVRSDRSRLHFVSRDDAARVLAACPDAEWRLIFALARFGGLRVPSELEPLTWGDVHWPDPSADDPRDRTGWVRVTSPKTAHHPGGGERVIPMFPELLGPLRDAFDAADEGAVRVIPRADGGRNLGTQLKRIVRRAGLTPWPKTFQNLRSTRQTELAREHPDHVVCEWIGNSRDVAAEHYLHVTGSDFAAPGTGAGGDGGGNAESNARATHFPTRSASAAGSPDRPVSPESLRGKEKRPAMGTSDHRRPLSKCPGEDSNLHGVAPTGT